MSAEQGKIHEPPQVEAQQPTQDDSQTIQDIKNNLDALPERSKKETKIQKILRLLKPNIEQVVTKGYTVKEIYDIICEKGIKEIKESKLRSFVTQIRSEQKKKEKEAKLASKKAAGK